MAYSSTKGLVYLHDTVNTPPVDWKFPLDKIRYESYKVTPDQNQDLNSTVDTTGNLHRYPLDHTRSKVEFNMPVMNNTEMNTIISTLSGYWNKPSERKVTMEYYDPLTDGYKTGSFYIPDIDFVMMNVDESSGKIMYQETRIAFIEY